MVFSTASAIPRPIRLKDETRKWADASLHGKYGDEAIKNNCVVLDAIEDFDSITDMEKYDVAIRKIAENAPVRICSEERICGSATLGDAIKHVVPARFKGNNVFSSVSHLTIDYERVIKEGLNAYSKDIAKRLEDDTLEASQISFLHSLENVIESIRIWHDRYLNAVKDTRPELYGLLSQVPFSPARTFHEVLQSLWFIFAFVRLCGNWPGIGRIDMLLGSYLKSDLENGIIDEAEARELLASFFIKGCEWIQSDTPCGSGDAQHYQNIVLSGTDESGCDTTNEVTYLVLDIVEELPISDYPITVRLSDKSPYRLKKQVAEVIRHGGGTVAVYNESLILKTLKSLGYPDNEAVNYANDGCWEVQIPGKTDFTYYPFDALQIFNRVIGITEENTNDYTSIEEIYSAFRNAVYDTVHTMYNNTVNSYICKDGEWRSENSVIPTSVISLFEDGCIRHARSYYDLGPEYTVRSPHIGGAPDAADSFYAVDRLVFKEKKLTLTDLVSILKNNWVGNEELRLYVKNSYTYYGNDFDDADIWHTRILNDFADIVNSCNAESSCPVKFTAGVSTFGRQLEWLPNRSATAFGYKKGDILSGNDSPVPGTDSVGATAVIKSHCKADLVKQISGAALDIKLLPDAIKGEKGTAALISLIDGFLSLGGFFLQLDTVDTQTLLEAQRDPQKFKTLSVRVSGWNARFVTLNKEWQDMIIERSAYGV